MTCAVLALATTGLGKVPLTHVPLVVIISVHVLSHDHAVNHDKLEINVVHLQPSKGGETGQLGARTG